MTTTILGGNFGRGRGAESDFDIHDDIIFFTHPVCDSFLVSQPPDNPILKTVKFARLLIHFMSIVFHPALDSSNVILVDSLPAVLNFTATLSSVEYESLRSEGGRIQLWSDMPVEGGQSPRGVWASCDFGFNMSAGDNTLDLTHAMSLGSQSVDNPSPRNSVMGVKIIVPLLDNEQSRFSFTYRIQYPSGEIRWLGEFGKDGALVFERTAAHNSLGLYAGWTCKEGVYVWMGAGEKQEETAIMKLSRPHHAFLGFITSRHKIRCISAPPEYIVCASPASSLCFQPDGTVTVSGSGSLHLLALPHDFRLLKDAILKYCSPERVAVTDIGQNAEHWLITTKGSLPFEGIVISSPTTSACSSLVSVPTSTLRALLAIDTPLSVFAPQTGDVHLVTNTRDLTFTSAGPFILSPVLDIVAGVYISVLSAHKSAQLVEAMTGILPTPPPSPELVARTFGHHLSETAAKPDGSQAVDFEEEENQAEIAGVVQQPVPGLRRLEATILHTRHLFSVALFVVILGFRFFFGGFGAADPEDRSELDEDEDESPARGLDADSSAPGLGVGVAVVMPDIDIDNDDSDNAALNQDTGKDDSQTRSELLLGLSEN
ncbi:hypothetical protein H0H87_010719, partial [Tephrocybe sp. NHM501043]